MERREMLAAGFRSLAQALPALLAAAGSLALVLDHKPRPRPSQGSAFPQEVTGLSDQKRRIAKEDEGWE